MSTRPEIFISATTGDLKTCRELVSDELLTLGCVPIVEEHFGTTAGEIRQILRPKIADCQAVIHLAGTRCGTVPQSQADPARPRSYTQLEYDVALELGKPVYVFVLAETFPYDPCDPEAEERRLLQTQHRAKLMAGDAMYHLVKDREDLRRKVDALQANIDYLRDELAKAQVVLAKRAAEAEAQNAALRQEVAAMRAELERQGKTSQRILEGVERLGGSMAAPEKSAAVVGEAQNLVARESGFTVAVLQGRLAAEGADLRTLLGDVTERGAAAATQAAEWRQLRRDTLLKLGDTEAAANHYAAAVDRYREALSSTNEGAETLRWSEVASRLATTLFSSGRYAEAEALIRHAWQIQTAQLGEDHPATLDSVNNLGVVLKANGDYEAAEALLRQALAGRERTLGEQDLRTLDSLNNLGSLLSTLGRYADAEPLYRRAIKAKESTLGAENPSTLGSLNNLANLLQAKGDDAGAGQIHRRVLKIRERTLGKEHLDTLSSVNNLAITCQAAGDSRGAAKLFRRALEGYEHTLGPAYPDTLDCVDNLANVLTELGEYPEAEALHRRAVEGREKALGKEHPDTLRSIHNLASHLLTLGRREEAEPLFRRVLAAQDLKLGKTHPNTLQTVNNLALLLFQESQYAESAELYRRVWEASTARQGKDDPATAEAARNLASVLGYVPGRWPEALALAAQAVDVARNRWPEGNPKRVEYEGVLRWLQTQTGQEQQPSSPPDVGA